MINQPVCVGSMLFATADQADRELELAPGHIEHALKNEHCPRIHGMDVSIAHRGVCAQIYPLLKGCITHRFGIYQGGRY